MKYLKRFESNNGINQIIQDIEDILEELKYDNIKYEISSDLPKMKISISSLNIKHGVYDSFLINEEIIETLIRCENFLQIEGFKTSHLCVKTHRHNTSSWPITVKEYNKMYLESLYNKEYFFEKLIKNMEITFLIK